jgi:hypothetical protein
LWVQSSARSTRCASGEHVLRNYRHARSNSMSSNFLLKRRFYPC